MPARHILIPIHDFSAGGTELIAFRLASHWLATGRQVTILAGARDGPMIERVPQGAAVHVLDPERSRWRFSRVRLGAQMAPDVARIAPDLVFIPGNFHFGLARAIKAAVPQTKIIGKISNPLVGAPFDHGALAAVARPVLKTITAGIDWFAAMSPGLAQDLQRQLGHARVSTLYDPNIPDGPLPFIPHPPRNGSEPLRLLGIGRLEPQKNWPLAFEAIAKIRQQTPVTLRIFGQGPDRAQLEQRIAAMDLSDVIDLAGFTDRLAEEFAHAHALLITSHFEGGPAVAAEALAHGLPVVATDCSHFLRDLIDDPTLGTLVSKGDAAALGKAAIAQTLRNGPTDELVARKLAPLRFGATAKAYLDCFDRVCEG
ncbi:glycosyltransferase [Porphyrobacter algicida]|uniref:Glycosyltransferase n=1 Tax=Qipengyuania algicida TaxID=1836209 RepID=A0A845AHK2_9SPHN|nr:glycosyltransferase [Qipengyuania algicida]